MRPSAHLAVARRRRPGGRPRGDHLPPLAVRPRRPPPPRLTPRPGRSRIGTKAPKTVDPGGSFRWRAVAGTAAHHHEQGDLPCGGLSSRGSLGSPRPHFGLRLRRGGCLGRPRMLTAATTGVADGAFVSLKPARPLMAPAAARSRGRSTPARSSTSRSTVAAACRRRASWPSCSTWTVTGSHAGRQHRGLPQGCRGSQRVEPQLRGR